MDQIEAKVTIKGIRPFLWHYFRGETLSTNKKRIGNVGDNSQEWKDTVLMDDERRLFIYSPNIVNSIAGGGKTIKMGRANIAGNVLATLLVKEDLIYFDGLKVPEEENLLRNPAEKVYLDVRSVVNPMTKGRNMRYRVAASPGWTCSFTLMWDESIVSKEQIKHCIQKAGIMQGLGDGRKIGLGRYELVSFAIVKN